MISVIMSVYNDENNLAFAIESILNQSYKDFEFIIINDSSNDNSKNIILDFQKKDKRIVYLENQKNEGLAKSLNKAISISKGKFIARMDSDDICMMDRFKIQIEFLENNTDIDVLGTGAILIDKENKKIGNVLMPRTDKEIKKVLIYKNSIIHPSVIIKKYVLIELGGYNPSFLKAQDLDLWVRLANNGKNFYNLQEYLINYRVDLNKSYSTIIKGFKVSFLKAFKYKSVKGILWSITELVRMILVKHKLYIPRSMQKNGK